MVVRVNQICDFVNHAGKYSDKAKTVIKHADSPIQQSAEFLNSMPELLAKTFIKDTSLSKSALTLPSVPKSDLVFKNKGGFNQNQYVRSFEQRIQDMREGLYCIDNKELKDAIKSSGDLYSFEEISKMEEMISGGISVQDAIKCRGSEELLQVFDGKVKPEPEVTIKHLVEEYVNKLAVFKEKDKNNFSENTKKINKFIETQSEYIQDSTLYRGEQSERQIHRLISLALEKQQHPQKTVKYAPNHLWSTTNNLKVLTDDYDYADKCLIKIVGTEGKCKGIDVNKMLGSKNRFFTQKETLLSGTSEFEVIEGHIENNRLMVTLKYIPQ